MGHSVCPQELRDLQRWLLRVLPPQAAAPPPPFSSRRPPEAVAEGSEDRRPDRPPEGAVEMRRF